MPSALVKKLRDAFHESSNDECQEWLDFLEKKIVAIVEGHEEKDRNIQLQDLREKIDNEHKELYKACAEKWGVESQILMAIEECSELSVELCHFMRNIKEASVATISDEIADVEIMIEQLKYMFNNYSKVEEVKNRKYYRLDQMVHDRPIAN